MGHSQVRNWFFPAKVKRLKRLPSSIWNRVTRYEDNPWLPEAREVITRLECLPEGWDSYGSNPIQSIAAKNAIQFLFAIPPSLVPAPHISPVPGGGIGFHWRISGRDLEVECKPDGTIEALQSFVDAEEESKELTIPAEKDWHSIIRWVAGLT
jgi:hypothetical protein